MAADEPRTRIGSATIILYVATIAVMATTVLLFFTSTYTHPGARGPIFYFALCYFLAIELIVGVLLTCPGRLLRGEDGLGDAPTMLFFVGTAVTAGGLSALALLAHVRGLLTSTTAIIIVISVTLVGGAIAAIFGAVRVHNKNRVLPADSSDALPGLISPHSRFSKEHATGLSLRLISIGQLVQDRFSGIATTHASQIGAVISLLDQASVDLRSGSDLSLVMAELHPVIAALETELVVDVPGGSFSAVSTESLTAALAKVEGLTRQVAALCSRTASI